MELPCTAFSIWILQLVILRSCFSYPELQRNIRRFQPGSDEYITPLFKLKAITKLKGKGPGNLALAAQQSKELGVEKENADPADVLGANPHHNYPATFLDFGRRFVPQYPYTEKEPKNTDLKVLHKRNQELIPVKASPEKVLTVALESALQQASQVDKHDDESVRNNILRTGDYWDSVWVEEVDPAILRSYPTLREKKPKKDVPRLGSVKAKIMPGSKLYQLVSVLKKYSPRLLYVINNKN